MDNSYRDLAQTSTNITVSCLNGDLAQTTDYRESVWLPKQNAQFSLEEKQQ